MTRFTEFTKVAKNHETTVCALFQKAGAVAVEMHKEEKPDEDYAELSDPRLIWDYGVAWQAVGRLAVGLEELLDKLSRLHALMSDRSQDGGAKFVLRAYESMKPEDRARLRANTESLQGLGPDFGAFTDPLYEGLKLCCQLCAEDQTEAAIPQKSGE